jgi:hypothetical protein
MIYLLIVTLEYLVGLVKISALIAIEVGMIWRIVNNEIIHHEENRDDGDDRKILVLCQPDQPRGG